MNALSHVPPGFRFHPTDEELVDYYLRKKIFSRKIELDVIKDVDLYKIEPWDLQDLCRIGREDEQDEWYFFSHKDKKYPTGTRTNRATAAGFWKATGRDKAIYSKHDLIGMRKTLVFYQGRAPNGQKSDWIMHEYRLETDENGSPQEEGWVVCRVFKKKIAATMRKPSDYGSPSWYEIDNVSFNMPELDSPKQNYSHHQYSNNLHPQFSFPCKKELSLPLYQSPQQHSFLHLPLLEPGKSLQSSVTTYGLEQNVHQNQVMIFEENNSNEQNAVEQLTDWRVFDKYVASQFSTHEEEDVVNDSKPEIILPENASMSASSSQGDMWK